MIWLPSSGADFTVKIDKDDNAKDEINRITNGNGFDVVLDTVSMEGTLNLGIKTLNRNRRNSGDWIIWPSQDASI